MRKLLVGTTVPARRLLAVSQLIIVTLLLFLSACSGDVTYTPPFGVVTFGIGTNGISVSAGEDLVTPIGIFAANMTFSSDELDKQQPDEHELLLTIKHWQNGSLVESIYMLHIGDEAVTVTANGHIVIQITDRRVTVDASQADIQNIEVRGSVAVTPSAQNDELPSYMQGQGTLVLSDPLSDNSNGNQWDESDQDDGFCRFADSTYHMSEHETNSLHSCFSQNSYSDFAYEVSMRVINGDCGGLLFRAKGDGTDMYLFLVCHDRVYKVSKYDDSPSETILPTPSNDNSSIVAGFDQENLLAVVVRGSTLKFYINQRQIAEIDDDSFSEGQIGLGAGSFHSDTEVAFSNARVWTF